LRSIRPTRAARCEMRGDGEDDFERDEEDGEDEEPIRVDILGRVIDDDATED